MGARRRGPTSIYEHVRSHIPVEGPGLGEGGEELPDEAYLTDEVRWMPGAEDGVIGHHFGVEPNPDQVDEIFELLGRAVISDRRSNYRRLYAALQGTNALTVVDQLLPRIPDSGWPASRVEALGRHLATEAGHREVVKMGIALLGLVTGSEENRQVLLTLGRHDEFTLFAAVALWNSLEDSEDPEPALWELARNVDGWGRIQLVERLATRATRRSRIGSCTRDSVTASWTSTSPTSRPRREIW